MKTLRYCRIVVLVLVAVFAATAAASSAYGSDGDGVRTATLSPQEQARPLALTPLAVNSLTWPPLIDTYVYQRSPNARFDASRRLLAGRDRLGYAYWTLLRFELTRTPLVFEPYVHDANLRVWLVSGGSGQLLTGLAGKQPIYANTTWMTKPGVKWLPELTRPLSGASRWVSVPVTDIINRSISLSRPKPNFILSGRDPGAVWAFASTREPYAPHRPKLDVVYAKPRPMSGDGVDTTLTAGSSDVVTVTVTQDMGAPWAGSDICWMSLNAQDIEKRVYVADFLWSRERPDPACFDSTRAPSGGWYGTARWADNALPRYDRWKVSVSPDGRRMSVTFVWSVSADCAPCDPGYQACALAVPPGCSATRTVGVWERAYGGFAADPPLLHVVAPQD